MANGHYPLTRMALEPAGYTIHATQFEIRYYEDCVQIQNLIHLP